MRKMAFKPTCIASLFLLAVSMTTGIAGCSGSQTPTGGEASQPQRILFTNGVVLTMDEKMTEAQAVALEGEKIIAVGTNDEILKYKNSNTEVIDLTGKTLMPGFVETHSHPMLLALVETHTIDIRPATGHTDGAEIMALIRGTVEKARPGEYLVFFGWDPLLQKGLKNPTLQELDALSPNNPMVLWGNSVHVAFANSKAFELAGITKDTPDISGGMGGTFGHDENGELNGRLDQGGPINMVLAPFLGPLIGNPDELAKMIYQGWLNNASQGVTTITDDVLLPPALAGYLKAYEKYGSIRLFGCQVNYQKIDASKNNDRIHTNCAKLFVDGSPWTGTITMSEPYLVNDTTVTVMDTPPGYLQKPYVSREELQVFIDDNLKARRTVAIHAEGDQAIEMSLDAIEEGLKKYPWEDHRFRLLHVPMITDEQIQRAEKLGVQLTFLMAHVRYWGDVIPTLVGDSRGQRWCPVKSAVEFGANYAFHFDGPTSPNKPLETLQTLVTRQTVGGSVLGPEQRITVDEALRGYTINAAYQLSMDKQVGSIEVGKLADLIVLSDNPRRVAPDFLSQIRVLATYVNGEKFWSAP